MNPESQKYLKQISKGTLLFKEGDKGSTMFVIVKGCVELLQTKSGMQGTVGVLGAGETLGERALLSTEPYIRNHTARAAEDCVVLEVDNDNVNRVHDIIPDFTKRILVLAASRLDKANQMIDVLMTRNDVERVLKFLVYNCHHSGTPDAGGTRIELGVDNIEYFVRVSKETIGFLFELLQNENLLRVKSDALIVASEKNLFAKLDFLKAQLTEERLKQLKMASAKAA